MSRFRAVLLLAAAVVAAAAWILLSTGSNKDADEPRATTSQLDSADAAAPDLSLLTRTSEASAPIQETRLVRVIDMKDRPVADAEIRVSNTARNYVQNEWPIGTAIAYTDARGEVRIPAQVDVLAWHPSLAPVAGLEAWGTRAENALDPIVFRMARAATLSVLRLRSNGSVDRHAMFHLQSLEGELPSNEPQVVSIESFTVTYRDLSPGWYYVRAVHYGNRDSQDSQFVLLGAGSNRNITLNRAADRTDVELAFVTPPDARVEAHILGRDGEPFSSSQVHIALERLDRPAATQSRKWGHQSSGDFSQLDPGTYRVRVDPRIFLDSDEIRPRYPATRSAPFRLNEGETRSITVEWPETGSGAVPLPAALFSNPPPTRGMAGDLVILRVLDDSGYEVALLPLATSRAQTRSAFRLVRFGVGSYQIELTRAIPGAPVGKHFRGSIEITAEGDAIADLQETQILNARTPQVRIAMRTFDTLGLPTEGVRIELTDENGARYGALVPTENPRFLQRFRVPAGRYSALLSRPGDVSIKRTISIQPSDDGKTFDLYFER